MGVLSNKVDREQLKPGDHIYSWRRAYVYAHHGIYVGDGMVIHFTRGGGQEIGTGTIFLDHLLVSSVPPHDINNPCPRCGDQSKKEGVISSCLDCFLYGGNLCLFEYGVSLAHFLANARGGTCTRAPSDPTEVVLHRASILLEHGFGAYDIYKKNCEDFAIYCKTGLLVCSGQAASCSAAADAVFSAFRKMINPSPVSVLAMVGDGMYSYYVKLLASDIGRCHDASKMPVESLIASLKSEKTADVPVERPLASLGLNKLEKTAEVPVERPIASPSLNEQEKTAKTAKENQHWLNRGSVNRGGRLGYRGGGRGRGGRRPYVTCQVCLESGHSAYNCYYRFDYNYLPRQSPQPVFPPGFRPHSAHLAAMPTTPQVLNDKSRFPDSGATNHVTVDRENLVQRSEYNGSERLSVGNGTEAESRKMEEAERLKSGEVAEKQGQSERELEEKERQRREAFLGRGAEPDSRPFEPPTRPPKPGSAAPASAAGPAPGKYVPRFKREKSDGSAAPPPETNRWINSSSKPGGNRWRSDDRRPAFGSGGGSRSRSTWSSSRNQRDR